jgi:MAP/microtubule affinity-regulating kinase
VQPRTRKAAFSTSTTSAKPPLEILAELQNTLARNGITFEVYFFVVKCKVADINFELEICKPPRLNDIYFIHPSRLEGNEWEYKNILNKLISELKL